MYFCCAKVTVCLVFFAVFLWRVAFGYFFLHFIYIFLMEIFCEILILHRTDYNQSSDNYNLKVWKLKAAHGPLLLTINAHWFLQIQKNVY